MSTDLSNPVTHCVTNQAPDLAHYNLYDTDTVLQQAVERAQADGHTASLRDYGRQLGSGSCFALAHEVNRQTPRLQQFDRQGNRSDSLIFHPGWHRFMTMAFRQGLHCSAWSQPGPGAHAARAAAFFMHGQLEAGSLCPTTMTAASIPLLQNEDWFPEISAGLFAREYDRRDIHFSSKTSFMVGMGMTEKQGGSDLRSNTTQATAINAVGRGQPYLLTGHKWFFSSPTSDAHLVLASHKEQFSCFFVPRWLDDQTRNKIYIQRIKDKLGNRSNASVEVEFQQAVGTLVGEEGRGIAMLTEMASYTRLDCVLGSTAILRQAVVQALHHCRHRRTFGRLLADHELMQSVLQDLVLESEAATTLAMRIASAFDQPHNSLELAFRRILTPAAKFWIGKRAIHAAAECMEVWGGNGYIEDGPMARLYREAPVNSIWEGSGNIMCLDVLRAWARHPELALALSDYLRQQCQDEPILRDRFSKLSELMCEIGQPQLAAARYMAQELVLLTQAALLRAHAPQAVADAFLRSRFTGCGGRVFGVQSHGVVMPAILQRAWSEKQPPRD